MAQFTVYKSSDASAPVLDGQVGSLVNLLDKCLVTGYGAKAAAGWTKPYTGTNKAAFQQGAGCGFLLRVQDDAPGAGGAKEARCTGYESMSDVDTGGGPYPTAAQGVGGVAMVVWRKSAAADATTRDWILYADSRTFYFFPITGDSAGRYNGFMFGDIYSLKTGGDSYSCMIVGKSIENNATISQDRLDITGSTPTSIVAGHFMARTYAGTGGSITLNKQGQYGMCSTGIITGTIQYPNGPDSGLYLTPVWIIETSSGAIRGRMRGFWINLHAQASFGDGDTFDGANGFTGKSFVILKQTGSSGVFTIETSDTLETN